MKKATEREVESILGTEGRPGGAEVQEILNLDVSYYIRTEFPAANIASQNK